MSIPLPKLRELREAFRSLFSAPYTTRFPYAPVEPVDGFRGKPEFSEEHCVGCGACAQVCIGNAIKMIDPEEPVKKPENAVRKMEVRFDMCNFCGNCQAHCITEKGIQLTKIFDLSCFDRKLAVESIEKELIVCELCNSIITTRDHLKWLIRRLGTLAYGNPTLLLVNQRELIPVESGKPAEDLRRPDILKVLCPRCRQTVMVKDIWG
ncbi:4Fe-4S dicluster domain-containing protein [bacterium]|nr:4Fe-4S dicluster domain-containing protein [bacterium]